MAGNDLAALNAPWIGGPMPGGLREGPAVLLPRNGHGGDAYVIESCQTGHCIV